MPGLAAYLSGFGIREGLQLAGYELYHIQGSENTIKRYHDYQYSLQLLFKPAVTGASPDQLLATLKQQTAGTRIIDSSYNNPYECDFGKPSISSIGTDGSVIIVTIGNSHRIYHR